jgi:hypothetical protein
MRPKILAVAAILLCMSVITGGRPAEAAAYFNAFEVKEVPVDVTADTAANARNIAIGEAQSRALDVLLRRMTLKEHRGRLPKLDGNSVSRLVQSLQFDEERYSSTRYIGKVTVAFSPGGIRSLLGRYNIPFAEAPSYPIVVLPVFDTGAPQISASNAWWNAWARQDWQANLLSLTLPRAGDLAMGPSVGEVMQGAGPWVEALGGRYGTSEVVVPVASLRGGGGSATLTVNTRHYGIAGEQSNTVEITQQPGETVDAMLIRAARDVGDGLTYNWKRNAMIGSVQTPIVAVMDLSSLQQLITVKERLKQAPIIKNATVVSLATHRALFNMTASVPAEQLTAAMTQYGIDLTQRGGDWYVALRR